jgi:6-phosphogluconolactonase/glucosamine-6-phosphate isomerase/deaminase
MGDDGHTASLFPHSPALEVTDRWVAVNAGPHVTPPDRLTMTFPLLNAARELAILVTGAKKASTIERVRRQLADHGPDPQSLPITGIDPAPHSGELTWFLDPPAAGR